MTCRTSKRGARALLATAAFVVISPTIATAGPIGWTEQFGSLGEDDVSSASSDRAGNVYLAGDTNGTLGASALGEFDAYVRKLDADGNVTWTQQFGTNSDDFVDGIAVTSSGDSYVAGTTSGPLAGPLAGESDVFLVKFDKNGNQKWAKQYGGPSVDESGDVAVSRSGNVYVAGATNDETNGLQATLTKFDKNGNQKWQKIIGTSERDYFEDVSVSSGEDIYVVGSSHGSLAADNAGGNDIVVMKFDKNGNQKWARQFGTTGDDSPGAIALTAKGDLRVIGSSTGTMPGASPANVGDRDGFVVALDKAGTQLWARTIGTDTFDTGRDVGVTSGGVTYVIGKTEGDFPGSAPASGDASYVATFTSTGTATGVRQYTTGGPTEFSAIVIRQGTGHGGPIVLAGSTNGTLFGHTNSGNQDGMVVVLPS